MIIGRLRTDDIYGQVRAYPRPEHRSTALSSQACMLYIISFFAPDILENEQATMREIVDKHFADNWIISYYLGYTADLSLCWAPYPAAAAALANTVQLPNISKFANLYTEQVHELTKKLDQFLTEVSITKQLFERQKSLVTNSIFRILSSWRFIVVQYLTKIFFFIGNFNRFVYIGEKPRIDEHVQRM
jgi:WASH complex subunit strumpellin